MLSPSNILKLSIMQVDGRECQHPDRQAVTKFSVALSSYNFKFSTIGEKLLTMQF